MAEYVFVGTKAQLYRDGKLYVQLDRYGQTVELTDEEAAYQKSKQNIIEKDKFSGVGFTDDELKRWASPLTHTVAPQEFLDKKQKVVDLLTQEVQPSA